MSIAYGFIPPLKGMGFLLPFYKFERLRVSFDNGKETRSGSVRVVLDVPVEVTAYGGDEVSDEDVELATIEAIQEGKAEVVQIE